MRTTFVNTLRELASKDERIFLLTADMGYSVLETFREEFPDRFLNVGIAEQNVVGVAAGLAMSGKIVYVYSIIPFVTMRCFEQVPWKTYRQRSKVETVFSVIKRNVWRQCHVKKPCNTEQGDDIQDNGIQPVQDQQRVCVNSWCFLHG